VQEGEQVDEDDDHERGGEGGGVAVVEHQVPAVVGGPEFRMIESPATWPAASSVSCQTPPGGVNPAAYVTVATSVARSRIYLLRSSMSSSLLMSSVGVAISSFWV
jgi:hypothetical protein